MAEKSNALLTEELKLLKDQMATLQRSINELTQNVNARPKLSDLSRSEQESASSIRDNAELINQLELRLSKVVVPGDTRYYLLETEIASFRSTMSKLLAMMANYEKLYRDLVAYSANVTS